MKVTIYIEKRALTKEREEAYRRWAKEFEELEELDKEGYLIEDDFKVEEMYIEGLDDTGDLNISCYIEGVYVSVQIPFKEWFTEFAKKDDFTNLLRILSKKRQEINEAIRTLKALKKAVSR